MKLELSPFEMIRLYFCLKADTIFRRASPYADQYAEEIERNVALMQRLKTAAEIEDDFDLAA